MSAKKNQHPVGAGRNLFFCCNNRVQRAEFGIYKKKDSAGKSGAVVCGHTLFNSFLLRSSRAGRPTVQRGRSAVPLPLQRRILFSP